MSSKLERFSSDWAQPYHEVVENAEMRPVKNGSPTQLKGFIYEQFFFLLVIDLTVHQGTVQMVHDPSSQEQPERTDGLDLCGGRCTPELPGSSWFTSRKLRSMPGSFQIHFYSVVSRSPHWPIMKFIKAFPSSDPPSLIFISTAVICSDLRRNV